MKGRVLGLERGANNGLVERVRGLVRCLLLELNQIDGLEDCSAIGGGKLGIEHDIRVSEVDFFVPSSVLFALNLLLNELVGHAVRFF